MNKISGVYFMACRDSSGREFVKIGYSGDVQKRIRKLQTGNPFRLQVDHVEPGTRKDERRHQRRFEHLRANTSGEWIVACPETSQLSFGWYPYEGDIKGYVENLKEQAKQEIEGASSAASDLRRTSAEIPRQALQYHLFEA